MVADAVRLDKGHTEGLGPKVTQAILQLIAAAPGGKAQRVQTASNQAARSGERSTAKTPRTPS